MEKTLRLAIRTAAVLALCMRATGVSAAVYSVPSTDRSLFDLSNQSWTFTKSNTLTGAEAVGYSDASWTVVRIPHTWNSHADKTFYTNCWYRTHFTGSSTDTTGGKRVYLYFGAVTTVADVYLNGVHLGQHKGGYTAFIFDATSSRKDGDNVLAVKVDNLDNPGLPASQDGWMHFGGISRKVWILTTNRYSVDPTDCASPGVYITQSNVSASHADLSIRTVLRNTDATSKAFIVKNIVCDSSRNILSTVQSTATVNAGAGGGTINTDSIQNPVLWNMGNAYLYTVYTEVWVDNALKDMVASRIGIRFYSLTANNFTMNGSQHLLRGACMHAECESKGNAIDSQIVAGQFDVIKDLGINYLRLVHYPHPEFTYNIADERGIPLSTEVGDWGSPSDIRNADRDNNVREMVKQKFNHPSVIFWCAGNEDSYAANVTRWAFDIDSVDGSKPVYFASAGANPPGVDFVAHNIYGGWYGGSLTDFPQGFTYVSESGAGGVVTTHQSYVADTFAYNAYEPEEYQDLADEYKFNYLFVAHPTNVPLYSHWVLFDMCDTKYKGMNTKGMVTYGGMPKDCYYMWKATARPGVPLVYICGKHWYVRTGSRSIKVYSNRTSVTLSVNGTAKGTKANGAYKTINGSVVNNVFLWDSVLSRGRNDVVASDGAGTADSAVLYYEGSDAPNAPADSSEFITNLTSGNAGNAAYFVNVPVHAQWPVYYQCDGNADNTFDTIPSVLQTACIISTKRQSDSSQTSALSFKIGASLKNSADVYVLCTQQSSIPPWISAAGFVNTGITGQWRDNALNLVGYQLFKKTCSPGASVSLAGSTIDYVAFVNAVTGTQALSAFVESARQSRLATFISKTYGEKVLLPDEFAYGKNLIEIYALSGKRLWRTVRSGNSIDLKRGSHGVYIVKVQKLGAGILGD